MSAPSVSVVLPTFDRAESLERAVRSVLDQSYDVLELIVVDDASTDGSVEALDAAVCDPRLRTVRHRENRGAAAARNTGLEHARGDLIAFQDSDDVWLPGALDHLVAGLLTAERGVGVCFGSMTKGSGLLRHRLPLNLRATAETDLASSLASGNIIPLPASIVRKDVIDRVGGFDPSLRTLEDWELFLRLASITEFRHLDRVVAHSPRTPGGVNSFSSATLGALDRIESLHGERLLANAEAQAQLAYLRGCAHAALGSGASMRRELDRARSLSAKNKYRLASAASILGPAVLPLVLELAKVAANAIAPTPARSASEHLVSARPMELGALAARVSVIVPTRNAGHDAGRLLHALDRQSLRPFEVVAIDSESADGTAETLAAAGARVLSTSADRFRHGAARNRAAREANGTILVFLTQDVVPEPDCLERLVAPLVAGEAAASYARQRAPEGTPLTERFARLRNYPAESATVGPADLDGADVRTFFFSNACSAVRSDVFWRIGGFDERVIMNEDMNLAATILERGGSIRYVAEACVEHAHAYLPSELFRRYFDIGVALEASHPALRTAETSRSGLRYAAELGRFLAERGRLDLLPRALLEVLLKASAHALGRRHRLLPARLRRTFSLHRAFWP